MTLARPASASKSSSTPLCLITTVALAAACGGTAANTEGGLGTGTPTPVSPVGGTAASSGGTVATANAGQGGAAASNVGGAAGTSAGGTSAGAGANTAAGRAAAGDGAGGGSGGAAVAGSAAAAGGAAGGPMAGSDGAAGAAGGGAGAGAAGSGAPVGPVALDQVGPYEVQLDQPVGEGFEYPIASSDTGDGVAGCKTFAESFGSDPADTMALIELPPDLRMDLYSLYRPKQLEEGKKYPIITWGNGTCAKPEGYRTLLRHVASHGFFVIAANSRQVGRNSPMTKALDWAEAADKDPMSPYYGKLDLEKIGAMGHSQGGSATVAAARDPRVKTAILWNGGTSAASPFLAVSGDRDIVGPIDSYERGTAGAPEGAYLWYKMIPGDGGADGHLTLMTEPERVVGPATAWFRYQLQDDPAAREWFVGDSCKLCSTPDSFVYGQNGLK